MGLFSSKYRIYVSSVPYNVAGDPIDRVSYLKTSVSQAAILGGPRRFIGETFLQNIITGPAVNQKNFFRWARENYSKGMGTASLSTREDVNGALVAPHIPVIEGAVAEVISAFIDTADPIYWAQKHVLENRPEMYDLDWTASYDGFTQTLTISYPDSTMQVVPTAFGTNEPDYLVAIYRVRHPGFLPLPGSDVGRMFIYRIGTGIGDLDVLNTNYPAAPEFFPIIPLRLYNKPIDHEDYEDDFPIYKRAYKKAMQQPISKVLANIEENENVNDIDHAFLTFGVELNTTEQIGRRYIFEFFRQLVEAETNTVKADRWLAYPTTTLPPTNKLVIRSAELPEYNVHLSWVRIKESRVNGLGKAGAKEGELWFENLPNMSMASRVNSDLAGLLAIFSRILGWSIPRCKLYYQDRPDSYRVLDIFGLEYRNYVYGGNAVTITSWDALRDPDESGFIIPMHYPTLQKLSLMEATELALVNRIIVFNCYQVVKVRWYQRGIFKFLAAIFIGALTGFLFPGAFGLLGSNAALGASLGVSGALAGAIGGAINAVAAMVLLTAIEAGAIAIFGEKWGALIGALIGFFTMSYVMNFQMTGNAAFNWGDMLKAENLMKLADAVTGSIAAWARGEMADLNAQGAAAFKNFEDQRRDLEKRALELLGYGGAFLDPLMFGQVSDTSATDMSYAESRDSFLARTLMTGSDIVALSHTMIEEFPEITLELPKSIA